MTDNDKALVERLREGVDNDGYDFLIEMADADMREAAERIEALEAENGRLREHLISALDTLKDAEVCDDNCGPCNEARAALQEQNK